MLTAIADSGSFGANFEIRLIRSQSLSAGGRQSCVTRSIEVNSHRRSLCRATAVDSISSVAGTRRL